nr:TonB-dependent receptor [Sphingomonas sp. CDS-1]
MKSFGSIIRLACVNVTMSSLMTLCIAHAQSPINDDNVKKSSELSSSDGDIIVTALKRSQSAQDIPTTVSVTSGTTLTNAAITSIDQLTQVTPGLRLQSVFGGLVAPTVRGISSSPSNNSFEQAIGLYIDGIFAGHPRDYVSALFDVERVEVLKGTQGATLGKNTSIGAVSIVTRKPGNVLGYNLSYMHEFELNSEFVDAGIDVPLTSTLSARIAGQLTRQGGWINYRRVGRDLPTNKTEAIRGTLRWEPSDRFDWTAYAQASSSRITGTAFFLGADVNGNARATAALYGVNDFQVSDRNVTDQTGRAGYQAYGHSDGLPFDDSTAERYTSLLNYRIGDHTISSTTGYSEYVDKYLVNLNATANNTALRTAYESNHSFSQELRINSSSSQKFTYLAGLYYYRDKWGYSTTYDIIRQANTPVTGAAATNYLQRIRSISVFGQAGYEFNDALSITGSLRYDHSRKTGSFTRDILRPGLLTAVVFPAFAPTRLMRTDNVTDFSVAAQYKFAPRSMVYASYATGSKGGGYQAIATTPSSSPYGPEHARTAELGTKIGLPDGGHVNLALFNTKVRDYQFAYYTGTIFVVRNDQIRSRGVELDVLVRPVDGLDLSLAVTYADVEKTRKVVGSIDNLPWAPKLSGIGQVQYDFPISANFAGSANIGAEFRTRQNLQDPLSFTLKPTSAGYVKINGRLAISELSHGVELALVAKNIFDKRVVNYVYPGFLLSGTYLNATDPSRTIGLQITFKK